MIIMEQIFEKFVEIFLSLTEKDKFILGKKFNEKTGGKLSPHNNPTPIVVSMIQIEDEGKIKLLGIKRGIAPHIGGLALPGGYQDYMEDACVGVAREVLEETGLKTNPEDYGIFGNPSMSPTNNELKFFLNRNIFSKEIMKELVLNSEVESFELIDEETELCFPLHEQRVKSFFDEQKKHENNSTRSYKK